MSCGLVLEGGARRGVFTAGVLDVFMEQQVTFPYVIGVSAGAATALNFLSGQVGRSRQVFVPDTANAHTPLQKLRGNTKSLDLNEMVYKEPYSPDNLFDFNTFFQNPAVCEMVVTDCTTGEARYIRERQNEKRLLDALRASCSVPLIFAPTEVDGVPCLDGSIADSLPFERAYTYGCDRAVVVLTKCPGEEPTDYRRYRKLLTARYEKRFPELCGRLIDRFDRYAAQREQMEREAAAGRLLILRPASTIHPFELSEERVEALYQEGRTTAQDALQQIREFNGCNL